MSKITPEDIINLGFTAEMFKKSADTEVIGTDGLNYRCIKDHISAADNKPIIGANFGIYWLQSGEEGAAWADSIAYESSFFEFINISISEESLILEGRLSATLYNSTISPIKEYVKRAELCLVAAELLRRRINIILGNVVGAGHEIDVSHEEAQRKVYLNEAENLISKIVAGITSDNADFVTGVLVTSHFEEKV